MAGYSIYAPNDDPRAPEFGPSEVLADATAEDLYRAAGFRTVVEYDTSRDFAETCERFVRAGEAVLQGPGVGDSRSQLEDELERKTLMYRGVSEGLLGRSLIVAS